MDSLDDRVKNFFRKCGSSTNSKQENKDEQFQEIKQVLYSIIIIIDKYISLYNYYQNGSCAWTTSCMSLTALVLSVFSTM